MQQSNWTYVTTIVGYRRHGELYWVASYRFTYYSGLFRRISSSSPTARSSILLITFSIPKSDPFDQLSSSRVSILHYCSTEALGTVCAANIPSLVLQEKPPTSHPLHEPLQLLNTNNIFNLIKRERCDVYRMWNFYFWNLPSSHCQAKSTALARQNSIGTLPLTFQRGHPIAHRF